MFVMFLFFRLLFPAAVVLVASVKKRPTHARSKSNDNGFVSCRLFDRYTINSLLDTTTTTTTTWTTTTTTRLELGRRRRRPLTNTNQPKRNTTTSRRCRLHALNPRRFVQATHCLNDTIEKNN